MQATQAFGSSRKFDILKEIPPIKSTLMLYSGTKTAKIEERHFLRSLPPHRTVATTL